MPPEGMSDPSYSIAGPGGGDPSAYLNAPDRDSIAPNGKDSFTIDEAAARLIGYGPGWSANIGDPATITYAYRSTAPLIMPDDAGGFSRFTSAQIDQAELALRSWSDVANITFVRVGGDNAVGGPYSNSATILFANYSTGVAGASAFGYNPSHGFSGLSPDNLAGDVWINSSLSTNRTPTATNYGGQTLLHELGHAIGLTHPSDYDAGDGVTFTYTADASYYEDSRQYTVMSYFSETNTGAAFAGLYASSPLLDDIAAAQKEYGPNMTTRTGDTVYGFNSNLGASAPWFVANSAAAKVIFAVWDAGGHDTFDFSGYANNQFIDLRAGFFSDVGGLKGNVAIAQGVTIEAATGGSGADTLHGNDAGNQLLGGAGNDSLAGGAGVNYLWGNEGNDTVQGGGAFDNINGNQGNDNLRGGAGDDWVVGGKDDDIQWGDDGGDVVWGNLGNDTLDGGAGADQVRGGQGDDLLTGGAGDDYVSGDLGADTESGGAGADRFHTWGAAGVDRVLDFNPAEGDRVMLDPGTAYTVAQVAADTVISMTGGAQMTLVGVQMGALSSGWIFESWV